MPKATPFNSQRHAVETIKRLGYAYPRLDGRVGLQSAPPLPPAPAMVKAAGSYLHSTCGIDKDLTGWHVMGDIRYHV